MAKINNSDYERWAKRKSTMYLVSFLKESVPARAKARLFNPQLLTTSTYFDRKINAAHKELLSRQTRAQS